MRGNLFIKLQILVYKNNARFFIFMFMVFKLYVLDIGCVKCVVIGIYKQELQIFLFEN